MRYTCLIFIATLVIAPTLADADGPSRFPPAECQAWVGYLQQTRFAPET